MEKNMKVKEFNYEKKNGEKTSRQVMIITDHKDYLDAIDLDKLTESEIKDLFSVCEKYEEQMKPFIQKSFRRFSKSGITELNLINANEVTKNETTE
jgi:hypothetical protein